MNGEEARQRLYEIFGSQLKFNKQFDQYAENLKEGMMQDLLHWCKRAKENKLLGSVPSKKKFKHLYTFFRKIGSDTRAILIKEQNSQFIEVILTGHRHYDETRLKL